jgi:hypothetical protein
MLPADIRIWRKCLHVKIRPCRCFPASRALFPAKDMTLNALTALSPLDGRYAAKVESLRIHFSEYGLIRNRVRVEIEWLKALAPTARNRRMPGLFGCHDCRTGLHVSAGFSVADAEAIKTIEARTNHDVKAMEYWLKDRLAAMPKSCASASSSISAAPRKTSTMYRMR